MLERVKAVEMESLNRDVLTVEFLDSLDSCCEGTKATYKKQIRRFFSWLETNYKPGGISRKDIVNYRTYLVETGKTTLTVGSYMTALKRFFEWMESTKKYPNVAKDIKAGKKPKGYRKDCLSDLQVRETMAGFDTTTLEGLRDYAIFTLQAHTGLRTVEVSRALVEDIRQVNGKTVLWIQGKGRTEKDDFVVLTKTVVETIERYFKVRKARGPEPLFTSLSDRNHGQALTERSISRIIKTAMRKAGIDSDRLTAHSLRHTAISKAIQGGASFVQTQAMARHADPKTTMVYFHNHERLNNNAESFINY